MVAFYSPSPRLCVAVAATALVLIVSVAVVRRRRKGFTQILNQIANKNEENHYDIDDKQKTQNLEHKHTLQKSDIDEEDEECHDEKGDQNKDQNDGNTGNACQKLEQISWHVENDCSTPGVNSQVKESELEEALGLGENMGFKPPRVLSKIKRDIRDSQSSAVECSNRIIPPVTLMAMATFACASALIRESSEKAGKPDSVSENNNEKFNGSADPGVEFLIKRSSSSSTGRGHPWGVVEIRPKSPSITEKNLSSDHRPETSISRSESSGIERMRYSEDSESRGSTLGNDAREGISSPASHSNILDEIIYNFNVDPELQIKSSEELQSLDFDKVIWGT